MDIRKFLSTQSHNNTLDAAIDGFEKSSFVEQSQDVSTLLKTLLNAMIRHSLTDNSYNPVITPADPPIKKHLHTFVRTSNSKTADSTTSYLSQLQSGGITPNKNNKSGGNINITSTFVDLDENDEIDSEEKVIDVSKRQSYCTEFNQMIYNIQGLLGSEFSKYIFVIAGNRQLISNEISCISRCDNYSAIIYHLKRIKALLELADTNEHPTNNTNEFYNDDAEGISIEPAFWTSLGKFNKRFVDASLIESSTVSEPISSDTVFTSEWNNNLPMPVLDQLKSGYFNYNSVSTPKKSRFIDFIIKRVTEIVETDNILMFCEDKDSIQELLQLFLSHLRYGKYYVNNVDDLVINLGCNGFVYDKSFLKMFEILFKETFADIPFELWQPAFNPHDNSVEVDDFTPPYTNYIRNELGLDIRVDKYIDAFTKYYNKIFVETIQSVTEKLPKQHILTPVVTNKCYNLLAHITFNMFMNLAKRIANNQVTLIFFGKSTRIQFIQVFQGLLDCTPRNMLFSCTQRMMIHYVLMSRKSLQESAKSYDEVATLVKNTSEEKTRKKRASKTVSEDTVEKDDDSADSDSTTSVSKKQPAKKSAVKKQSVKKSAAKSSVDESTESPESVPEKPVKKTTTRKSPSKKSSEESTDEPIEKVTKKRATKKNDKKIVETVVVEEIVEVIPENIEFAENIPEEVVEDVIIEESPNIEPPVVESPVDKYVDDLDELVGGILDSI